MPFEDIAALDEGLHSYGSNPALAKEAVHAALDEFLTEVDSEMSNFGSVGELEDFEEELHSLIERRNYQGNIPFMDIDTKRGELQEMEDSRDSNEGYNESSTRAQAFDASDAEIKSMFMEFDQH